MKKQMKKDEAVYLSIRCPNSQIRTTLRQKIKQAAVQEDCTMIQVLLKVLENFLNRKN